LSQDEEVRSKAVESDNGLSPPIRASMLPLVLLLAVGEGPDDEAIVATRAAGAPATGTGAETEGDGKTPLLEAGGRIGLPVLSKEEKAAASAAGEGLINKERRAECTAEAAALRLPLEAPDGGRLAVAPLKAPPVGVVKRFAEPSPPAPAAIPEAAAAEEEGEV
jgi:hypothetical protein